MEKILGEVTTIDLTNGLGEALGEDTLTYGIDLDQLAKGIELEVGDEILFEPLSVMFTTELMAHKIEKVG